MNLGERHLPKIPSMVCVEQRNHANSKNKQMVTETVKRSLPISQAPLFIAKLVGDVDAYVLKCLTELCNVALAINESVYGTLNMSMLQQIL